MPSVGSRTVTELMARHGHEQVVFVADAAVGLRAVIAVHSTALGPSLGGVRFWRYDRDVDALARRAPAVGGDVAEGRARRPAPGRREGGRPVGRSRPARGPRRCCAALGRAIDDLGGRYLAAEDVGATTADMDALARVTPWVTGVDEQAGGSGDPSPVTAFGVRLRDARRGAGARRRAHPRRSPRARRRRRARRRAARRHAGRRGCGRVGERCVRRSRRRRRRPSWRRRCIAPDDALAVACDVLAPCALGGMLDDVVHPAPAVPRGRRCGEQPARERPTRPSSSPRATCSSSPTSWRTRAASSTSPRSSSATTAPVRSSAPPASSRRPRACSGPRASRGVTPQRAAEDLARDRIAEEGARRRWEPGDPAAWTNGAPLTRLRPTIP